MHKLKQLIFKDKTSSGSSSKSASGSGDARTDSGSSTPKQGPKHQDNSGSSTPKQDPKHQASSRSSTPKKADPRQANRRPSISEEREPTPSSSRASAIRQEIEYQAQSVLPAPALPDRKVGGGYRAPKPTRRHSKSTYNKVTKASSLSTIRSEDSTGASSSTPQHEKYAFLKSLETVFVVDDSVSMAGRWQEISSALQVLVPICAQYVKGGVEVAFLNRKGRFLNAKTATGVVKMFDETRTIGTSPTGEMLCMILRKYIQRFERWSQKWGDDFFTPLNIIVITSGNPTDDSPYFQLRNVIERNALKLQQMKASEAQLGIHFFQVGQDNAAADFLQELDDDCKNGKFVRDIIDTTSCRSYDGVLSPETVFGAVEKRLTKTRKGKSRA